MHYFFISFFFAQPVVHGGLRQTKIQTDRLETELWWWRNRCRNSGKKIPKRLVQARAKWAFHKEGILDFKVSWVSEFWYYFLKKNGTCNFWTEFIIYCIHSLFKFGKILRKGSSSGTFAILAAINKCCYQNQPHK